MLELDPWLWIVTVFGAIVGASELLARYRDAPLSALRTRPAVSYVVVNAIAALGALLLIRAFGIEFGVARPEAIPWTQALVAGFGSMAFFRSSLFTVRVGESDVAIGPGIFLQIILFAADRACDRERAQPRSVVVNEIMEAVSFDKAQQALPTYCFGLMQNVPPSEQQQFAQQIAALASSQMSDSIKTLNLGLALMNVVGEGVLRAAVRALGTKIQGPAKAQLDTLLSLKGIDFGKAYPVLVDVSLTLWARTDLGRQAAMKEAILKQFGPIAKNDLLDNSSKMTFLALTLQQQVGDAVVQAALAYIRDRAALAEAAAPAEAAARVGAEVEGALAAAGDDTGKVVALNPPAADSGPDSEEPAPTSEPGEPAAREPLEKTN